MASIRHDGAATSETGVDGQSAVDLSTYDPMDREVQQCPFAHYAAVRAHGPIFRHERSGMYFAARLDVVNEILRDTETYSSRMASATTVADREVMRNVAAIMAQGWPRVDTMLTIDPSHHTRYRKLVARSFSARRIAVLEPAIRAIAVDLIEGFPERGTIDFHADFAVRFPVRVIHEALAMAPGTEGRIKAWSDAAVAALGVALTEDQWLDAARTQVESQRYWHDEYQHRLLEPRDDILSELAHADFDDPDLSEGEVRPLEFPEVFSILQQLMVAGNETTTKLLNETMRLLIEHPEWWQRLVDDPDAVVGDIVEEGLRMSSPNQGLFRVATRDTAIGGVDIPEGARIWVMFGAANRDGATFEDPESFDAARDHLREHIAFGKGHHFCIGAPLARLEARIALEELSRRLELPAFSEGNTFEYEPSYILRGLARLDLDVARR